MKVFAGDLGGTHARLEIAEVEGTHPRTLRAHVFPSADYEDPAAFLTEFLAGEDVAGACLAVAGPVEDHRDHQTAHVTNLPWDLDSRDLARRLGLPALRLINDFQAVGYGLEALQPKDRVELQTGHPRPHAPRALIGAGTGLGMGLLVWQGGHYEVLPSEGGHAGFAPAEPLQDALLAWLRKRYGHVSWERVLSGPGLVNLYHFLRQRESHRANAALDRAMAEGDAAAQISEFALWHGDALAREALELFVRLYGAAAGDLALTTLPRGGLYIAGGIAPKILDVLHTGEFVTAFRDKGRMTELMATFPVRVVINTRVGLMGAALAAARLAEGTA